MLLFLIFIVGLFTGDMTWAFKVAGAYVLALLLIEALFWMMCFGLIGVIVAAFL